MDVVDRLKYWNLKEQDQNLPTEEKTKNYFPFALAILLALTTTEEIAKNTTEEVYNLITELLRIRTKNEERVQTTIHAIREYCQHN